MSTSGICLDSIKKSSLKYYYYRLELKVKNYLIIKTVMGRNKEPPSSWIYAIMVS